MYFFFLPFDFDPLSLFIDNFLREFDLCFIDGQTEKKKKKTTNFLTVILGVTVFFINYF